MSQGKNERLRELEDREHNAREILRKLDCPDGSLTESLWTAASYVFGQRTGLRLAAHRTLKEVEEVRRRL